MDEKGNRAFNAPEYFEEKRRTECRHDEAFVGGRSEGANPACSCKTPKQQDDELDEAFRPAGLTILLVVLAAFAICLGIFHVLGESLG